MTKDCPINKPMSFGKPGSWNHWSIEIRKNGYEVNQQAGSVTENNQNSQTTRAPASDGNGETDRTI